MNVGATPSQRAAIDASGQSLVVAGAGAGKTRTLVERCLSRLVAPEGGVSPESILLVTFTNAAAAEIRRRLRERVEEAYVADPESIRLAEILALLDSARISTLHVFCQELIRENFQALDLDPRMTTLEEAQRAALMQDVLDQLLESEYAHSAEVVELVRLWAHGREAVVRKWVLTLYDYAQTLRQPRKWLEDQIAFLNEPEPSKWEKWYREAGNGAGVDWAAMVARLPASGEREAFQDTLQALALADSRQKVDDALGRLDVLFAGKLPKAFKEVIKSLRPDLDFLLSLVRTESSDPLKEDWDLARQPMLVLLGLVVRFQLAFSHAKREAGFIDFPDMEQFALQLLWSPDHSEVSAVAQSWRRRIEMISVDEYQDINEAQDAILLAVGRDGDAANRFLVGDVKQSIYRFRRADPRIFLRYQDDWAAGREGRVIFLSENFRSHEKILAFANSLFRRIMRKEVGGVDYTPAVELRMGNRDERPWHQGASETKPRVELLLALRAALEEGNAGEGSEADGLENDEADADEAEAWRVGNWMRELRESKVTIHTEGGDAPVDWNDMVILMRAPSSRGDAYARVFDTLGIPLETARDNFLESAEVLDLESLLQILDNPLQDLPLLAVLHSPFGGFGAMDLANVRQATPEGQYWTALQRYAAVGDDATLRARAGEFLQWHARWREEARRQPLSHCLEAVLEESFYREWIEAGEHVAVRLSNVREFVRLTREFDLFHREGLFRFIEFLRRQRELETPFEPKVPSPEKAVRLMSIHQSKGLEFPVVAIAGLGKGFNEGDINQEILVHPLMGLCPKVGSERDGGKYPSIAWWRGRRDMRRELAGEELRLLYVAVTRARDYLLLSGGSRKKDPMGYWAGQLARESELAWIGDASSALDWIGCWLLGEHGDGAFPEIGSSALISWRIVGDSAPRPGGSVKSSPPAADSTDDLDFAAIRALEERVTWVTSHKASESEPAKTSVSAIRRRQDDDEAALWGQFKGPKQAEKRPTPAGGLTGAEVGIAHHTFLQWARIARLGTAEACRQEAEVLVARGFLERVQSAVLDFDALAFFWNSDIGRAIGAEPQFVHREMEFTARFAAAELESFGLGASDESLSGEFILVQGVIDLALIRPGEIWIVDFKTDRIEDGEVREKVEHYRPQLLTYARALEKSHRRPVTRAWLHFLACGRSEQIL